MNLKEKQEGYQEDLERGKRKGNYIIYVLLGIKEKIR